MLGYLNVPEMSSDEVCIVANLKGDYWTVSHFGFLKRTSLAQLLVQFDFRSSLSLIKL